ncbi:glycosyltransferase family 4 protein [Rhodococcus sp. H29-C3]|uniref:glycosyltransferase family 4 protein n=1 Tax=Rhodococcus sp. H29-C3 TaxID=3046307 RepID=UPI0024B88A1A|nr:glycosyltransferase family 4 protein [Rhodococcus sp. H29-C3]MDJ0363347.1 glycosyltransferase family 4 protein [Rhodococcus sp. H29-C3]
MKTTLIITNDFPPRQGGIETFVQAMAARVPGNNVVVYTSSESGAAAYDATLPFPVIRDSAHMLLPTPRVTRRAMEIVNEYGCDRAWFGAAAPLAAMAPALRRGGVQRVVPTTHGHEIWWCRAPGTRRIMRCIGDHVDVITYLGEYTRRHIAPAVGSHAQLVRLAPGVDASTFRPEPVKARNVREHHDLVGRKVILCVSRLVARKGQDALIRALPDIQRETPEAALLIVGDGPDRRRPSKLAKQNGCGPVVFAGGLDHLSTAAYYATADVFAMPCRTRKQGLEAEGLGIVFLEAAASGLPVVVGNSGGAPDTVIDGKTGTVVDGTNVTAIATAISALLVDPAKGSAMGQAGRNWMQEQWSWDASADRLTELLTPIPDRLGAW